MAPVRARNAAATRHSILVAATRRFLQDSYECVGLRDIAGDVGVDVALVSRYFGSKEELFREVLRGDILEPFAELIQGRNPALRASFIMAVFMGITMVRTVMQVGPLCDADRDIVRVKVKQLFEAALSEAS